MAGTQEQHRGGDTDSKTLHQCTGAVTRGGLIRTIDPRSYDIDVPTC
jgi:hypothetical protein